MAQVQFVIETYIIGNELNKSEGKLVRNSKNLSKQHGWMATSHKVGGFVDREGVIKMCMGAQLHHNQLNFRINI